MPTGEDDVTMEDHDDGQSQESLTYREIQEVHKVMRNQLEDQVSHNPTLSSTISNVLTLVAYSMGDLSPPFYLSVLGQEVGFPVKLVSSH